MEPIVWPKAVLKLAAAITHEENSNPEWNNPGDLTYSFGFVIVGVANSEGVLKFKLKEDGEHALCIQCHLMLTGKSHVYHLDQSLADAGLEYAHGDTHWGPNVAAFLGVPPTTTFRQLAGMTWTEAA